MARTCALDDQHSSRAGIHVSGFNTHSSLMASPGGTCTLGLPEGCIGVAGASAGARGGADVSNMIGSNTQRSLVASPGGTCTLPVGAIDVAGAGAGARGGADVGAMRSVRRH